MASAVPGLGLVVYRLGYALRETAQALNRVGARLQGNYAFREQLNTSRPVQNLFNKAPKLGPRAFVAPSANVIGDVTLGADASVFYNSVIAADSAPVTIGARTNVQDGVVIRTTPAALHEHAHGTTIGADVSIGHKAVIFGATVGDGALVGIGAQLGEGSVVEPGAMVAAGAVVAPGTVVPSGQVWAGVPAAYLRDLKPNEKAFLPKSAEIYATIAKEHAAENDVSLLERAKAKGLAA